jgi:nitrogen regulatory protein PII-like uncharacterized protein
MIFQANNDYKNKEYKMYNKQKSYYKSLILTIIGLLLWIVGFSCLIIFGLIFNNTTINVTFVIVSSVGLVLFIIDHNFDVIFSRTKNNITLFYKYNLYGTPNNKFNEFEVDLNNILMIKDIVLREESKGVFKSIVNEKELVFDLRGWHNKKYCLYEYFLTIIQTELSKHNYKKCKKAINIKNIEYLTMTINFKNGKVKKIFLIRNHKTLLNLKFKHRLSTKQYYYRLNKIFIEDLYDFNI